MKISKEDVLLTLMCSGAFEPSQACLAPLVVADLMENTKRRSTSFLFKPLIIFTVIIHQGIREIKFMINFRFVVTLTFYQYFSAP